ncbi:peptidyl-prolyl cis-trans isomerase [Sulfurospirillum sp. 1612]|uniref:peptidyl-prolyl cis-trans isomerase n=1 Tax=Sulfurospirillum sp. 1612 TaxID=3094835 RepID=UPI002F93D45B
MKISMQYLSKIFISVALISSVSFAGLVDAISVIVNNQPITLYEVYKYAHQFKVSTRDSLDLLIRKKLEEAQIKKLGITVSDFEINAYVKNLATKNGVSEFQFYEMLRSKNIDEADYKNDLRKKLEQEKLYKRIIHTKAIKISMKDLQDYYAKNKSQFVTTDSFDVVAYTSAHNASLEAIQKNPMQNLQDVTAKDLTFKSGTMDSKLEGLLNATKTNAFTQVFQTGNTYTMFYVKAKHGVKPVPFDEAKNYIYSVLSSQQDKATINDYFDKLKSVATIKVLRRPNS